MTHCAPKEKKSRRQSVGRCRICGNSGTIFATKPVHEELVDRYMKCKTIGCPGEWKTQEIVAGDIEKSKLVPRRPRKTIPAPSSLAPAV